MSDFKYLTDENFKEGIQEGLILVDFYADWCGPCRTLAPILEKVAKNMQGKVIIAKIDIDRADKTAESYGVSSIPTLILFKDGKEINRLVGIRDEATINELIFSGFNTVV